VKYALINAHRREFDTAVMCRLLDVSGSGLYEWLHHPLSDRAVEDQRLLGLICASYTASHGIYGAYKTREVARLKSTITSKPSTIASVDTAISVM
jgi:putative transposase